MFTFWQKLFWTQGVLLISTALFIIFWLWLAIKCKTNYGKDHKFISQIGGAILTLFGIECLSLVIAILCFIWLN